MTNEFSSAQQTMIRQVAAGVVLTSLIRALEERSPGLHSRVEHLVSVAINTLPGAPDIHSVIKDEVATILDISSI